MLAAGHLIIIIVTNSGWVININIIFSRCVKHFILKYFNFNMFNSIKMVTGYFIDN